MARIIFPDEGENNVEEFGRITRTSHKRTSSCDIIDLFQVLYNQIPSPKLEPPRFGGALVAVQNLPDWADHLYIHVLVWAMLRNVSCGIFLNKNLESNTNVI